MAKMRVVQVTEPGAPLELVERDVPEPGPGQVRVRVEACGICHSDAFVKDGTFPGVRYPAVPGHEVAGRIDALGRPRGRAVAGRPAGRGGVVRRPLRPLPALPARRLHQLRQPQIPGIAYDGGYADYMVAPAHALAAIPDDLDAVEAAPLLCAGITTFNALRHSGARAATSWPCSASAAWATSASSSRPGSASRPSRSRAGRTRRSWRAGWGRPLHRQPRTDASPALQKLGGARVILATAPSSKAMTAVIDGLGVDGKLLVVGATAEPIEVTPLQLIGRRASVAGWPSGTAADSEDTLRFSALTGVRPMVETLPLERAAEGYERMISGAARFRVVLVPSGRTTPRRIRRAGVPGSAPGAHRRSAWPAPVR